MPLALREAAEGLLALTVLVLLPGLVIVRSSWPYVPFLSLSFWLVSWGWLGPAGPGRERFLHLTLILSGILAALRLLKPLGARRPSWPTVAVVALALVRLAPSLLWPVAPGLDAGFASSSALLLTWRDGIPASFQPLFPVAGFGLADFGLCALAADLSLLAGTPAPRAVLIASLASEGLLVLALFALGRRYLPPSLAALGSVLAASLGLLVVARSETNGGLALALALAISGASLVLRGVGRSASVAAGLLWAGALVTVGVSAGVLLAIATATLVTLTGRAESRRLALGGAVAVLLAAPTLWRTALPLELRLPLLAFALAGAVGLVVAASRVLHPTGHAWAALAVIAVALAATLLDWTARSPRIQVTGDDLAAAAFLREHTEPTDTVCADDENARAWIPALAGRAVRTPRLPGAYPDLTPWGALPACRLELRRDGSAGPAPVVFRRGRVTLTRLIADQGAARCAHNLSQPEDRTLTVL